MSEAIEQKLTKFESEYGKLLQEMRRSENVIKSLEGELQDKSKGVMMSKK